jgi:hypothetical protein
LVDFVPEYATACDGAEAVVMSAKMYVSFGTNVSGGTSCCDANAIVLPLTLPGPSKTFHPADALFSSKKAMYGVPLGVEFKVNENEGDSWSVIAEDTLRAIAA